MAGFGGGTSRYGGKAGSFTSTRGISNSMRGSFGKPKSQPAPRPTTGPPQQRGPSAGPQLGQGAPRPIGMGRSQPPTLNRPKPVSIGAPKPSGGGSRIDISARRNDDLDRLLGEQRQNIDDLKSGTGFAADATAIRTADAFEGAKNAANLLGGEGASGVRQTRQDQLTDAQLGAQAKAQTDLALGREGMVTNAIQNQLGTIMGQQAGMLGQQQIGLGAEGLRQQAGRDRFSQGLAGQQFAADVEFRNQGLANQAAQQQLQALQGAQGLYGNPWGGGGWRY